MSDRLYRNTQNELRKAGYVHFERIRAQNGRILHGVYSVHEIPNSPQPALPDQVKPDQAGPDQVNPDVLPNTDLNLIPTTTTTTDGGGGESETIELEFPPDLLPTEQEQAKQMITVLTGPTAQQVLDEWRGIITAGAIHASAIGCLRGLIKRAREGTFTQERGLRIAKARNTKRRVAAVQEASKAQLPPAPPPKSNDKLSRRIAEIAERAKHQ